MASFLALISLTLGLIILAYFYSQLRTKVLLYCLFPGFLLTIHGTGYLIAKWLLPASDYDFLLSDARIQETDVAYAFTWVIVGACTAYLAGYLLRGVFTIGTIEMREITDGIVDSAAILVLGGAVLAAELYLVATGSYGIGGVTSDEITSHISPLGQLLPPFVNGLLYLSGYMLSSKNGRKTIAAVLLSTQIPFAFLGGRRSLFVGLLSALFGMRMAGLRLAQVSLRSRIIAGFVAVLIFIAGYPFYLVVRNQESNSLRGSESVVSTLSHAYESFFAGTNAEEDVKISSQYNALTRPFYIGYPAMLMKFGSNLNGSDGKILSLSFRMAIPQVLWRNKGRSVGNTQEEDLAYEAFRLPRLQDESNTIITSGYTDFKIFGIFVYIGAMYLIAAVILKTARSVNSGALITYAIFSEAYIFVTIESGFVDWLVMFRNVVFLLVPIAVVYKKMFLPGRSMKARQIAFGR